MCSTSVEAYQMAMQMAEEFETKKNKNPKIDLPVPAKVPDLPSDPRRKVINYLYFWSNFIWNWGQIWNFCVQIQVTEIDYQKFDKMSQEMEREEEMKKF